MTERAARDGLYEAIDRIVEAAHDEFDAVGAVRRSAGGGPAARTINRLVKRNRLLDQHVVRPEMQRYREDAREQVATMVRALAAGEPVADHREALLANDVYVQELAADCSTDDREAIAALVIQRFERAAEAIAPVVAAEEDAFWPAVLASLTAEEARELVAANFAFADEMRPYRHALAFETTIDPGELLGSSLLRALPSITVEYTDESMRAMRRAEQRVLTSYRREIDRRYTGE